MLNRLYVRNYALIKELELGFDQGLTIITGETGAGKSIILGALGLILGKRADLATLLNKSQKCIVEGNFTITNDSIKSFFEQNDLDFSRETLIRREITTSGRSRAFINDTPVNLDLMKELGSQLIDIHSQHQTLLLGNNSFQLAVLDSFAGHNGLLANYSKVYRDYRRVQKDFLHLSGKYDQDRTDFDYFNHQLIQLDEAKLNAGEEKEIESERDLLMNAGEVNESLSGATAIISRDENSLISGLSEVKRMIERVGDYLPESKSYIERLNSIIIELNDLGNEIEIKSESIEADPGRLDIIVSRLDTIYSLLQKHRSESVKDLIVLREDIRRRVDEISLSDEKMASLKSELDQHEKTLKSSAGDISDNRKKIVSELETKVSDMLSALGMPNGKFYVDISMLDDFSPSGYDHADFNFTANKQSVPENLGKVASGGELSRVMLSLKSLLTDNKNLPTIFFDEIDAGVSGEVATRVGHILAEMGNRMQVINITHLPQVAAHATKHYYVYKEDEGDATITYIKLLNKDERLKEVARLLSGDEITKASLDNARELISRI